MLDIYSSTGITVIYASKKILHFEPTVLVKFHMFIHILTLLPKSQDIEEEYIAIYLLRDETFFTNKF